MSGPVRPSRAASTVVARLVPSRRVGHGGFPTIEPFEYREQLARSMREDEDTLHYEQRTWRLTAENEVPSHCETGLCSIAADGTLALSSSQNGPVEGVRGQAITEPAALVPEPKTDSVGLGERVTGASRPILLAPEAIEHETRMSTTRVPGSVEHLRDRLVREAQPPVAGKATYAGGVRVREPVARPLDIVAVELLLSASQAFLAGVLLYLAVGFWEDRGIGLGSVAAVVILLGLAVGAAWLYWLLGGVGWPMAGANMAAGLFLGAVLLLTWFGEAFRVGGAPLLLAVAVSVYGVAAGVFLDSPRRWRWDQRERSRPGSKVPRISPTTQALAAQVPRSLPHRAPAEEPVSELAARIEATPPPSPAPGTATPVPETAAASLSEDTAAEAGEPEPQLADAPDVKGTPLEVPDAPEPVLPRARLDRAAGEADAAEEAGERDAIELPTMVEPKAQRSPWAWAAPPEWNRDEDDEPGTRSSGRS